MTSARQELRKPKLWLDPGLMLALNADGSFSSILYRDKGVFSKWKVAPAGLSIESIRALQQKLEKSFEKSYRLKGEFNYSIDDMMVTKLKMIAKHCVRTWLTQLETDSFKAENPFSSLQPLGNPYDHLNQFWIGNGIVLSTQDKSEQNNGALYKDDLSRWKEANKHTPLEVLIDVKSRIENSHDLPYRIKSKSGRTFKNSYVDALKEMLIARLAMWILYAELATKSQRHQQITQIEKADARTRRITAQKPT